MPLEIVTRIEAFVIGARRLGRAITSAETENLAVLWGDCVSRATAWSWQLLDVGEALETAIGSPDGRFAVDVVAMFYQQLRSVDVTLILLFNAIVAHKLPTARSSWPPSASSRATNAPSHGHSTQRAITGPSRTARA